MEFVRFIVNENLDFVVMKYQEFKNKYPGKEVVSERSMNSIGYEYMRRKEFKTAIKIFKLNVEAYPESFNVYDSLGEAYMKNGDTQLAIINYEKSLGLNPDNENGKRMLEKLKKKCIFFVLIL